MKQIILKNGTYIEDDCVDNKMQNPENYNEFCSFNDTMTNEDVIDHMDLTYSLMVSLFKLFFFYSKDNQEHWKEEVFTCYNRINKLDKNGRYPRKAFIYKWIIGSSLGDTENWMDSDLNRMAEKYQIDGKELDSLYFQNKGSYLKFCSDYVKWLSDNFCRAGYVTYSEVSEKIDVLLDKYVCNGCIEKTKKWVRFCNHLFAAVFGIILERNLLKEDQQYEAFEAVAECIATLKPSDRKCILLYFLERKSYLEIALRCLIPVSVVKTRIARGLRKLRLPSRANKLKEFLVEQEY